MKAVRLKLAAAMALAIAALSAPAAVADPDPPMYCDCMVRCEHLYPNGGIPYATCTFNCEVNWGPALCKAPTRNSSPIDRR